jgi:N-acetylmuramoyl-L-alanine amidase
MLRGDDVHELQQSLGALGFDAGWVDGILGPETERALTQFQRNAGLTVDARCGPEVCAALARLGGRTESATVAGVRELERLRSSPPSLDARRVVVGHQGGLDALASSVSRLLQDAGAVVAVLNHPDASTQAREANAFEAELFIGLEMDAEPTCRVAFYETTGFRSVGGATLAALVASGLPEATGLVAGTAAGLRLPVLRETRMPAVVCILGPPTVVVERSAGLAVNLVEAVRTWVAAPVEG